jgi:hypothetical protein
MAVQARLDNTTNHILTGGESLYRSHTIAQNAQRTTDLLMNTVMALNATTLLWVPFTSLVETNGESVPRGVYLGSDIPAADLVAGNIVGADILIGDSIIDEEMLVWDDDTLNANSIVNPATIEARTAQYALQQAANIYFEGSVMISEHEN